MASKHARRRTSRTRLIETLEARQVMSADPLLGGAIEQHGFADSIVEPPPLVHHQERDADFWIDSWSERDLETLAGDVQQTLSSAHNSTGLTQVRNEYGFIGTGQTVAVIDSGIAYDHWALGGGFGANYRVVGGWDFTENDANPYDDGPSGSHGTHVAGIVGADRSGTNDDGVAPGVDLVGLRVFNDAGDGYFSWVESALNWVHQNRNAFENPITAVNLSLGAAWNSTSLPSWATLEEEFAQLEADGIFISVSAGNAFATYNAPGLAYPAASPHVVPVMSVKDTGTFSSFSQRHTSAIAAPGQGIVSTVPDYVGNQNGINDDFASFSGTSMAAPYVAGASVILREAMEFVGYTGITQDTIFDHMMATATTFFDSATSLNYRRLNMGAALDALMPDDDYGSTSEAAYDLGSVGVGGTELSGLIGTLSDADYFRFTAAVTGTVTLTADTTHRLAPEWNGAGTVSGSAGEVFTFDVVAGQTYGFGIGTDDGIGYYDIEFDLAAAALPPPTAPGALQVTATSPTQVELSWTDSSDETSYQIVRWSSATGSVVAATVGADVTSHTITNLPPGSRQYFQITARNGSGAATTAWQLVVMPQVPPGAPGSFGVAVNSPTSAALSWADATGENDYQIARWSAETGTTTVGNASADATSYTVTGLQPDSRQYFKVTARNSAGTAATSWVLAVTPPAIPPTTPGAFSVTSTSPTQVDLNWSDSTGEECYKVIRWSSEGTVVAATVGANATSHTLTNLTAGTRYWFRVQAANSSGVASTAWQLPQAPSGSTASVASGEMDGLQGFSVGVSQLTRFSLHDDVANHFQFAASNDLAHDQGSWPLRNAAALATSSDAGRVDVFSELRREDMIASLADDSAEDQLFDVLAESSLAEIHGGCVGGGIRERLWQDW